MITYLLFSAGYNGFIYWNYRGYKITNVKLEFIIYDFICIGMMIVYTILNYNLESK